MGYGPTADLRITSNNLLCKLDANGQAANPGFVTLRQRFPEITGKFVLHCHILGHEDRGMMQVVQVARNEAECQACH
ncbi:MAG: multicopper oxidase domain-containing protein [Roseiflexaceae bacterium]